jgi:hypothetical protein
MRAANLRGATVSAAGDAEQALAVQRGSPTGGEPE